MFYKQTLDSRVNIVNIIQITTMMNVFNTNIIRIPKYAVNQITMIITNIKYHIYSVHRKFFIKIPRWKALVFR